MKPVEALLSPGWHARLELEFDRLQNRSRMIGRRHSGPLVVQRPFYPEDASVCQAIVVHPPGGIAGGDRLEIECRIASGAHAQLTTPGAGKWYCGFGREARQRIRLSIGNGAICEWLPQENIVFDGAQASMQIEIDLEPGAMYCGWDLTCLGRSESGERFANGRLVQRNVIQRAGQAMFREQAVIHATDSLREAPAVLNGHCAYGTLTAVGPKADRTVLERARAIVDQFPNAGVTAMDAMIVARWVGDRIEQGRALFASIWSVLRPWYAQRSAVIPRIWST